MRLRIVTLWTLIALRAPLAALGHGQDEGASADLRRPSFSTREEADRSPGVRRQEALDLLTGSLVVELLQDAHPFVGDELDDSQEDLFG